MRLVRTLVLATVLLGSASVAVGQAPPAPAEALVVPTGRAPCGLAVREGALWVGVYETGVALRIDPRSGRVAQRIKVGRWACRIAVDQRALWVTRDNANVIVRIDRRTGRRHSLNVGALPFDVVLAAGSLWVTSYQIGTIARLDAANGRLVSVARGGDFPAGLTSCGGRIWVGHGREATWLTSIVPANGRVRRVDVGARTPGWPECVRGELWVTTLNSVLRVDARSGAVRARIRLGGTPADAAAGPDGLVWVTDKERSLVHRVDPRTNRVLDAFPAGPGAFALARIGGSMWITSFAGSDIRRYDS